MSLPSGTSLPPAIPCHPLWVVTEHYVELPASHRKFPLAIYFTYGSVYASMLLSQCVPLSCSPTRLFSMSAALQICPSVLSFWIPFIHVNRLYLSCGTCTQWKDSIYSSIWLYLV